MNNVIDFIAYRNDRLEIQKTTCTSSDLEKAIQILIQRLREHDPIIK